MSPKSSMTCVLMKGGDVETERHAQRENTTWTQRQRSGDATSHQKLGERPGTALRKKQSCLTPWSWTCSLQNREKKNVCCVSHLVCGALLWQPEQADTVPLQNGDNAPAPGPQDRWATLLLLSFNKCLLGSYQVQQAESREIQGPPCRNLD